VSNQLKQPLDGRDGIGLEDEATRMSVSIRIALHLASFGMLFGCVGLVGVIQRAIWGDICLGIGVGLLFACGLAGLDAYRSRGVNVRCLVRD
jgi:hypothetical protein